MKINPAAPSTWQDLQEQVSRILRECGMTTHVEHTVRTARGTVNIDVHATDKSQSPSAIYLCECKRWSTPVSKEIVHAFRTVVADHGASRGFLISSNGFQSGAREAAEFSNVVLQTWDEFEAVWADRWIENYLRPQIYESHEALCDYTEPVVGEAMDRRFQALSPERQQDFLRLRQDPSNILTDAMSLQFGAPWAKLMGDGGFRLPYSSWVPQSAQAFAPPGLLAATSLRAFGEELCGWCHRVKAEFDVIFSDTPA